MEWTQTLVCTVCMYVCMHNVPMTTLVCCVAAVTMAKGIGNGFPLGAVVTTEGETCQQVVALVDVLYAHMHAEIAHTMSKSLHFNTYGGNPMACTVGSAVLDVREGSPLPFSLPSFPPLSSLSSLPLRGEEGREGHRGGEERRQGKDGGEEGKEARGGGIPSPLSLLLLSPLPPLLPSPSGSLPSGSRGGWLPGDQCTCGRNIYQGNDGTTRRV